jgi:sulfite exporter TauE/SafE
VGLTLLTIGGLGIYETLFAQDHGENEDEAKLRDITAKADAGEVKAAAATFGTGVLYGLQPDSLFVIIPALALPSSFAAFAYCMMFVIGTVLAMGGYTLFLGTASEELCRDRPWLQQNLSIVASCVAIIVGVMVLLSAAGGAAVPSAA